MTDIELCKRYLAKAQNATDRGIPFELSFYRFKQLMLQKRCYYLNLPFGENEFGRTLDRKKNDIGYTDENTVACLRYINNAKNNLSVKDIQTLAKKLKQNKKAKT